MVFNCVFHSDISKTFMHTKRSEPEIVNQIVANYLYQHNRFKAGDVFICEAGVPEACTYRSHYNQLTKCPLTIVRNVGAQNLPLLL